MTCSRPRRARPDTVLTQTPVAQREEGHQGALAALAVYVLLFFFITLGLELSDTKV